MKVKKWETINQVDLETSKGTKVEVKLIRAIATPELKMIAINKMAQHIAIETDLLEELVDAIIEVCDDKSLEKKKVIK